MKLIHRVYNILKKKRRKNISDIEVIIVNMISEVKLLCLTEANSNFLKSSVNIGTDLA